MKLTLYTVARDKEQAAENLLNSCQVFNRERSALLCRDEINSLDSNPRVFVFALTIDVVIGDGR